jgi:hypothetical protein
MKDRGEDYKMFDRDWMCGVFWAKIEGSIEYIIDLENQRNKLQKQVDELKDELKDLDWYKMWHKKFKKEIDDLTLELETYRPTKLSGNGQCKCGVCGSVCWTDWFSRYKGKTLCNKCLKEIIATEEKQAVKDTAKEICKAIHEDLQATLYNLKHFITDIESQKTQEQQNIGIIKAQNAVSEFEKTIKKRYGVEVE